MCSECQAPTEWHRYGISICLFLGRPDPDSPGEQQARLLPDRLERCPARTPYRLRHRWAATRYPTSTATGQPAAPEALTPSTADPTNSPSSPKPNPDHGRREDRSQYVPKELLQATRP
ncbi:hypothetical protein GCM10010439_41580 [Actinocorallia aurantiaca]|uniref:Uncharacterized protein n=1 Tax=Actinocorallia aurantiaca TaxID=46204 RepID=A0ABP6GUA8_9ACTN